MHAVLVLALVTAVALHAGAALVNNNGCQDENGQYDHLATQACNRLHSSSSCSTILGQFAQCCLDYRAGEGFSGGAPVLPRVSGRGGGRGERGRRGEGKAAHHRMVRVKDEKVWRRRMISQRAPSPPLATTSPPHPPPLATASPPHPPPPFPPPDGHSSTTDSHPPTPYIHLPLPVRYLDQYYHAQGLSDEGRNLVVPPHLIAIAKLYPYRSTPSFEENYFRALGQYQAAGRPFPPHVVDDFLRLSGAATEDYNADPRYPPPAISPPSSPPPSPPFQPPPPSPFQHPHGPDSPSSFQDSSGPPPLPSFQHPHGPDPPSPFQHSPGENVAETVDGELPMT